MAKYRDSVDIIASILDVTSTGASKTKIMFKANLSYKTLGKYLESAIERGFIIVNGSIYTITISGQAFLARYRLFNDHYLKIQRSLDEVYRERKALERLCLPKQALANNQLTNY